MGALEELYPELRADSRRGTDDFVVIEYVMLKGRRACPAGAQKAGSCARQRAATGAHPARASSTAAGRGRRRRPPHSPHGRGAGVNDSEADARRLLELTRRTYCMINLIVFNPHEGTQFQRRCVGAAARGAWAAGAGPDAPCAVAPAPHVASPRGGSPCSGGCRPPAALLPPRPS